MSMHPALIELLNWSIDHPGETPPEHLLAPLTRNPELMNEWKRLQGWSTILKEDDPWHAPEGFFETLADDAMQEKRRADMTEPTRRELSLDLSEWAAWLWPVSNRMVLAWAVAIVLLAPVGWFSYRAHQSIGAIQYAYGHTTLVGNEATSVQRDETLWRGSVLQTTSDAQAIVHLEGGVEVCMDARSRLSFSDARTITLQRGRAYFDVPPGQEGFRVAMPHGEVFVLGTSFAIDVSAEQSRVSVTQGTVRVSDDDSSIEVTQGYEGLANAEGRLQQKAVPQLAQRVQWVSTLLQQSVRNEMQLYFPSLTGPTPVPMENQP